MTADGDRLAAILVQIREHNERHIEAMGFTEWSVQREPCGNVRLLLGVVEAVLVLADEWDEIPYDVVARLEAAQKVRQAISAELLGETGE